jgi:hypothetical protein
MIKYYTVKDADEAKKRFEKLLKKYDHYPIMADWQIRDIDDVKAVVSFETTNVKLVICTTTLQERLDLKLMQENLSSNVQ